MKLCHLDELSCSTSTTESLVGGLEHEFYVSIQLGRMIPTDVHIFQRGFKPPTSIGLYVYTYICTCMCV